MSNDPPSVRPTGQNVAQKIKTNEAMLNNFLNIKIK